VQHESSPAVSLHNVAETVPPPWADGGEQLCRLPRTVGANLNVDARERARHPTGCELRFVPDPPDEAVEVTLSAPEKTVARPFWGGFQPEEPVHIGPEPATYSLAMPDRIRQLDVAATIDSAFSPRVCRLRFEARTPVALHDVTGGRRPPREEELPDQRYLAYGTSITAGASASASHLSYVARVARRLGVDPVNLGMSGSAFCEPAMTEYLAGREDWDLGTLALSVNMATRGFTVDQFRERAGGLVDAVASAHPEKPLVCVTLFPYHADIVHGEDPERARRFRETLRSVVTESSCENLHVVDGPDVMDATGLTTDLLHPGDDGMRAIGRGLASAVDQYR
jgi:lysophospholipase L1-like esterase